MTLSGPKEPPSGACSSTEREVSVSRPRGSLLLGLQSGALIYKLVLSAASLAQAATFRSTHSDVGRVVGLRKKPPIMLFRGPPRGGIKRFRMHKWMVCPCLPL